MQKKLPSVYNNLCLKQVLENPTLNRKAPRRPYGNAGDKPQIQGIHKRMVRI
jgi:hypothetical protein